MFKSIIILFCAFLLIANIKAQVPDDPEVPDESEIPDDPEVPEVPEEPQVQEAPVAEIPEETADAAVPPEAEVPPPVVQAGPEVPPSEGDINLEHGKPPCVNPNKDGKPLECDKFKTPHFDCKYATYYPKGGLFVNECETPDKFGRYFTYILYQIGDGGTKGQAIIVPVPAGTYFDPKDKELKNLP